MQTVVRAALGAALAAVLSLPVQGAKAAEPAYLGKWTFTNAAAAPWSTPSRKPDEAERARLMGKSITIGAKGISGPDPFLCKGAHYAMRDYTPDLLFQGAFDEMRRKDKSVEPDKIAASLGFKAKTVRTLETGCEFDFHFVDDRTAQVGLNDTVYTLTKK